MNKYIHTYIFVCITVQVFSSGLHYNRKTRKHIFVYRFNIIFYLSHFLYSSQQQLLVCRCIYYKFVIPIEIPFPRKLKVENFIVIGIQQNSCTRSRDNGQNPEIPQK